VCVYLHFLVTSAVESIKTKQPTTTMTMTAAAAAAAAKNGSGSTGSSGSDDGDDDSSGVTFTLPLVSMQHMKVAIERLAAVSSGIGGGGSSGGGLSSSTSSSAVNASTRAAVQSLPMQAKVREGTGFGFFS